MSIPTSGAVTLADIIAEFGGATTQPLHDYVRGGSYVPNTATNAGVPISPPITIDDLRGASAYTALSITTQPSNDSQSHRPPVRPGNEPISLSTSMTTANGTVGSIVYSIANLTGDTGVISVGVTGNGTHSASITGTGTRNRFDGADYSVTFRVKATDGTSTVYSNYITFSDTSL